MSITTQLPQLPVRHPPDFLTPKLSRIRVIDDHPRASVVAGDPENRAEDRLCGVPAAGPRTRFSVVAKVSHKEQQRRSLTNSRQKS